MKDKKLIGTCVDETLVESIFGSVSEFARLDEESGGNFEHRGVIVEYNSDEDIHYFYEKR